MISSSWFAGRIPGIQVVAGRIIAMKCGAFGEITNQDEEYQQVKKTPLLGTNDRGFTWFRQWTTISYDRPAPSIYDGCRKALVSPTSP